MADAAFGRLAQGLLAGEEGEKFSGRCGGSGLVNGWRCWLGCGASVGGREEGGKAGLKPGAQAAGGGGRWDPAGRRGTGWWGGAGGSGGFKLAEFVFVIG